MGWNIQIEHIKLKMGFGGLSPPDTLENFYVRAYENYWNFIIFSFFPSFYLWFFPLLILQKNFGGGGAWPPQAPPCLRAWRTVISWRLNLKVPDRPRIVFHCDVHYYLCSNFNKNDKWIRYCHSITSRLNVLR